MILPGSYANGFAPRDGQPLYPELWRGCVGAWAPCLGPTGLTLRDWSGRSNHGDLTNMTPASDWVTNGGMYALDFDGTDDWVDFGTGTDLSIGSVRSVFFSITPRSASSGHLLSMWDLAGGVNQRTFIHEFSAGTIRQYWSPDGSADGTIISSGTLTVGRKYTVASVYRDGVRELWIQGIRVASISQASIYTGATTSRLSWFCAAGRAADTPVAFANGGGNEVLLYNRPLDQSEIRMLSSRVGIVHELAPRRRSSSAVQFNRRRRLLLGST